MGVTMTSKRRCIFSLIFIVKNKQTNKQENQKRKTKQTNKNVRNKKRVTYLSTLDWFARERKKVELK